MFPRIGGKCPPPLLVPVPPELSLPPALFGWFVPVGGACPPSWDPVSFRVVDLIFGSVVESEPEQDIINMNNITNDITTRIPNMQYYYYQIIYTS
jgi:hypothetical protein